MRRRDLLSLLAAAPLGAQQPAKAPAAQAAEEEQVIRIDVDLVSLLFSVRDKKGTFIKNLEQANFTVLEDNKKQDIRYFSRESNLPLTIGLLVDVSKSQENLIEIEKQAATQFFRQVLQKKDSAFLISFGAEAELLQDSTNSVRLLQKGLDQLRLSTSVGGLHPSPTNAPQRGTILYDAIYLAADEKLRREVGRKVIVVITDGMDYGSRLKLSDAITAAQKADAIIYAIYYVDRRAYGGFYGGGFGGGSDSELKKMAEQTGGRVFHAGGRKDSLEQIFAEIQEEMRSQYAIGYASSNPEKDGSYRKVDLKVDNKDYKVQARKGYFATKA